MRRMKFPAREICPSAVAVDERGTDGDCDAVDVGVTLDSIDGAAAAVDDAVDIGDVAVDVADVVAAAVDDGGFDGDFDVSCCVDSPAVHLNCCSC